MSIWYQGVLLYHCTCWCNVWFLLSNNHTGSYFIDSNSAIRNQNFAVFFKWPHAHSMHSINPHTWRLHIISPVHKPRWTGHSLIYVVWTWAKYILKYGPKYMVAGNFFCRVPFLVEFDIPFIMLTILYQQPLEVGSTLKDDVVYIISFSAWNLRFDKYLNIANLMCWYWF